MHELIKKADKLIPKSKGTQLIYCLGQTNRIGQLAQEIWQIKNIFRGYDEYVFIGPDPASTPRLNRPVFDSLTKNITWINSNGVFTHKELMSEKGVLIFEKKTYVFLCPNSLYRMMPKEVSYFKKDALKALETRKNFGIPEDARIIILHVREPGYLPKLTHHSFRDADIESYYESINWLAHNGYYVLRIGDSSMTKLNIKHKRLIDVAHDERNDGSVEAYLIPDCHGYIGTTAGCFSLAVAYNVPMLVLNAQISPFKINSTFVYKNYRLKGKNLTEEELIEKGVNSFTRTEEFEESGIKVVDNTPTQIGINIFNFIGEIDVK